MPRRRLTSTLDPRRLRLVLAVFFVALALPSAILMRQGFARLELDAFRQYQLLAESFAERVDRRVAAIFTVENARAFSDYGFLREAESSGLGQRSPLSNPPGPDSVPGLIGYFQIDAAGEFSTPLLPAPGVETDFGIDAAERARRLGVERELRRILAAGSVAAGAAGEAAAAGPEAAAAGPESETPGPGPAADADDGAIAERATAALASNAAENDEAQSRETSNEPARGERVDAARESPRQLQAATPAATAVEPSPQQALFDRLGGAGVTSDLATTAPASSPAKLEARAQPREAEPAPAALEPKAEQGAALRERAERDAERPARAQRITVFENELDPFAFGRLDSGHFVMFRNVWREGRRYVQGAVLDSGAFLERTIAAGFDTSALAGAASLEISYRGAELMTFGRPARPAGTDAPTPVLYQTRLSPPLADLALAFDVEGLPPAAGRGLLVWVSFVLAVALVGGFLVVYRVGLRQILLTRQQQDFVSAVSHELKTPLTSIRMYGEMLKAGWADESKKQTYYSYIYEESERLSRLIENVLQLARMNRGQLELNLEPVAIVELLEAARAKVATQVERAGFTIELAIDAGLAAASIAVDRDAFAQIFINLVDNALKFAAQAERRCIEVSARAEGNDRVLICVRDFGPGVPRTRMKRLFELFYRPANELTRATAGTGIGLGLVKELAAAMLASVDVKNCEPGAEFRVGFPLSAPVATS